MKEKTGIAIVGYSRPDYLKQCLESVGKNNLGGADEVIVCLDYKDDETMKANLAVVEQSGFTKVVPSMKNEGVAANKNKGLAYFMERGYDHIFLMEDDILMKDPKTCLKYVAYAQMMKLEHLNFAHHGPANVGSEKIYHLKAGMMTVYPHCVGAFSYYSKKCIEAVGYFDTNFKNAWEHVEHTYRIIYADMHPPFWYFPDYPASKKLLEEIPGSIDNSSIRPRSDWKENIAAGQVYWINKHKNWIPDFPTDDWNKKD